MTMELKVIGFRVDFIQFKKYLREHRDEIIGAEKGYGFRTTSRASPFCLDVDYNSGIYVAELKYKNLTIGSGNFNNLETLFDSFTEDDFLETLDIEKVLTLADEQEEAREDGPEESEEAVEADDIFRLGYAVAHHILNGDEIEVSKTQVYQFRYTRELLSLRVKQDALPGYIIQIISSNSERILHSVRELGDTANEAVLKFFAQVDDEELAKTISKDFDRLEAVEIAAKWLYKDDTFTDAVMARYKELFS